MTVEVQATPHAPQASAPRQPLPWSEPTITALLVLADGTIVEGTGLGATGTATGEVCFNTAMTGYQEILTDPSYAGQIVTFTFPHIGNVGANGDDIETVNMEMGGVTGVVLHSAVTNPSNYRAQQHFNDWLAARRIIGIAGIDTRALTALIRENGMQNAVIAHDPGGVFDRDALKAKAKALPPMDGLDLVPLVGAKSEQFDWEQTVWTLEAGYGSAGNAKYHVVAIDYGCKRNILRLLADRGCKVTVVPSTMSAEAIMAMNPDGVFLSNGPGDPAATGAYSVPTIRAVLDKRIPTFGICLGHQMMALAIGAKTKKMAQGHHGANHPVKDFTTNKVEIVSMNHGFAVDSETLPPHASETHVSLFDGSNCGFMLNDRPAFAVQHHPEASPGPQDSHYLFDRFIEMMEKHKAEAA
ncbi:MAG: glutamine-hydrolyzing carbamoyl-phosphate synthase small subunit [Beijerinckiaceae bacterium]|nr:glutamine-hydrolyzing carbamoyl-phosphate synthase small subunit [Beijerinckiaceae bacterium]